MSYHGVVFTEAMGKAFIGAARVVPLRNMGAEQYHHSIVL